MLTRCYFLRISALTAAGYAIAAEPILAQAIRTDTTGLVVGDVSIKSGNDMIAGYEARPDKPGRYPVVLVISEIWGLHEYIRDVARRFGKEGFYAIAPEMFQREGGVGHLTDIQEILKIVLNVPRQQVLQDLSATANYARAGDGAPSGSVSPVFVGEGAQLSSMLLMTRTSAPPWPGMAPRGAGIRPSRSRSAASMWRKTSHAHSSACSEKRIRTRRRKMSASLRRC
jgi:Dienelactone hydrolase family